MKKDADKKNAEAAGKDPDAEPEDERYKNLDPKMVE